MSYFYVLFVDYINIIFSYAWNYIIPANDDTLWKNFISYSELPRVLNPTSGFLQNCNTSPFNVTLDHNSENYNELLFSPTFGIENTMNNRGLRLLELFEDVEGNLSWEEFIDMKFDWNYSDNSKMVQLKERLLNYIQLALKNEKEWIMEYESLAKRGLEVIEEWDHSTSKDNQFATLPIIILYPFLQVDPWSLDPSSYIDKNFQIVGDRFLDVCRQMDYLYNRLDIEWGALNRFVRDEVDISLSGGPDVLYNSMYY